MEYLAIVIGLLFSGLLVTILQYNKLKKEVKKYKSKFEKMVTDYGEVVYVNCVLMDKLEKIKNLNLIDYNNNDYYKELLSTEIK